MPRTRLFSLQRSLVLGLLLVLASVPDGAAGIQDDPLRQAFITPPDSARPWVHWMWMDGNITRAGITADIESMQRVGIHGAVIMDIRNASWGI